MTLRIALIAHYLPAPANWGSTVRTYHLARGLARIGRVTLYCRTSEEDAVGFAGHPDLAPYARVRVHTWPRKAYAEIFKVFTAESSAVWMAENDPLADQLRADQEREPYDVLVSMQLFGANVARQFAPVPWVMDAHEIVDLAQSKLEALSGAVRSEVEEAHSTLIRAYENSAFHAAALVTCVTEAEADYVRSQGQPAVRVVRNGAVVHRQSFTPPSRRTSQEILFVGTFFWPPNARAARFLAREVMPRVWQEEPAARLVLCGRSPRIDVALLKRKGIEVTGTVASVQPYLDRAGVFANALFEGVGSSLKVLEALVNGIPLISTAVGVRGFALSPDRHYVAAEDADSFARAILAHFRDRGAADERARAGRAFAEEHDWDQIGQEFAEVVERVARRC
jgi:glycosyltransferase involved in cell wall biosynthesis